MKQKGVLESGMDFVDNVIKQAADVFTPSSSVFSENAATTTDSATNRYSPSKRSRSLFQERVLLVHSKANPHMEEIENFYQEAINHPQLSRLLRNNEIMFLSIANQYYKSNQSKLIRLTGYLEQCLLELDVLDPNNEEERNFRREVIQRIQKSLKLIDILRERFLETRFQLLYRLQREKAATLQDSVSETVNNMKTHTKHCLQTTEQLLQVILTLDALEPEDERDRTRRKELIQSIQESITQLDDAKQHIVSTFNFEKELLQKETANTSVHAVYVEEPLNETNQLQIMARRRKRASTITGVYTDQNRMMERMLRLEEELNQAIVDGDEDTAGELGLKLARMRAAFTNLIKQQQQSQQ
jgi:hypothetical protein